MGHHPGPGVRPRPSAAGGLRQRCRKPGPGQELPFMKHPRPQPGGCCRDVTRGNGERLLMAWPIPVCPSPALTPGLGSRMGAALSSPCSGRQPQSPPIPSHLRCSSCCPGGPALPGLSPGNPNCDQPACGTGVSSVPQPSSHTVPGRAAAAPHLLTPSHSIPCALHVLSPAKNLLHSQLWHLIAICSDYSTWRCWLGAPPSSWGTCDAISPVESCQGSAEPLSPSMVTKRGTMSSLPGTGAELGTLEVQHLIGSREGTSSQVVVLFLVLLVLLIPR